MSVLVIVGGTGSLGTAITEQQDILKENGVTRIRIISRDEVKQDSLEKNYTGDIPLQCFLGDVRNKERMEFALKGADYLISAAALKFIERFELDVMEGMATNYFGSQNVAKAALSNKLKSAILIGTDKQFLPTTSYGVSKLAATHLWKWFNTFQKETKFGICIWGNVFESRGSVISLWKKLAQEQKPLPITHMEMTRFFITKKAAAKFVLNSLFNNNSSIMIPPMKSTEMLRLSSLINKHYRSQAGVEIVGLRDPSEKLHEDLGDSNSWRADRFSDEELLEMIRCN